jgi:uncharacterized membrane protein
MEELFKSFAEHVALAVDVTAGVVIAFGAVEAVYEILISIFLGAPHTGRRKEVWLGFAGWLLLGLEFELAADIVRTAISPTWSAIGQLGAIAVIRTFLNYFLEKDLQGYGEPRIPPAVQTQTELLKRSSIAAGGRS